ncbi:Unknown protein [Striga hermonthica]|uniref:F-box domain-containing protein n=1 Tax=Striga hermonthica TaxID=68872 RepID=A0A9N7RC62_STRHE|nr:Unknown protein [Striga hermonthica]
MMRSLPDDILLEIFLRLPDKSLVRLKVLSKHWHLSISRMCVRRSIKPVVGLFLLTYSARSTDPQFIMRSALCVYSYVKRDGLPTQVSGSRMIGNYLPLEEGEEKGPSLLCWDDCFGSFGLPFRPVAVDLLDCCNGLLLFLDLKSRLYYVCNPLTRQYVSIPRPPFLMQTFCCGALAFDPSRGSTRYKVVRVDWSPYRDVIVDIYYSFGRHWVRRELKVDQCVRDGILSSPVVYFDGDLFRLSESWNLIRFDLKSESISVTGLPLSYRECDGLMGCMGVQMDRFMYANESCNVLYIWSLEKIVNNDVWSWDLKHKINIYDLTSGILLNKADAPDGCHWIGPVAFDPHSNVIYMGSSLVILRCNLDEDNSLEEMSRVDGNVMFLPGCHCQAFPYFRWLLPFTDAGDACDRSFLKFV